VYHESPQDTRAEAIAKGHEDLQWRDDTGLRTVGVSSQRAWRGVHGNQGVNETLYPMDIRETF
jgi:hypothetical protein